MLDDDLKQPTGREWYSFWALVTMQILQSFNVNASKFILVPLGAWIFSKKLAAGATGTDLSKYIITLCLVLPYLIFAPTAGWLSDRFAKTFVIRWTSWMQLGVLLLLVLSLKVESLGMGIAVFFLIAMQATLLSPSKIGVVKEYVGARRLGFASGVMEGTVVLAILAGQIGGGAWFDKGLKASDRGWEAALTVAYALIGLCLISIVLAHTTKKSVPKTNRPFSFNEAVSHMRDLGEFFKDRSMLFYGLGVAYFWGFGGFINLVIISIAEEKFGGGAGTGGAFASMWIMPVFGIVGGSVLASLISRKNIELGLAPVGAAVLTLACGVLAICPVQSTLMLVMLIVAGAAGAVFMVPLQAMIQEKPSDERRGAVISASNLLNSLAGIVAVVVQLSLQALHVPFRLQFLFIAACSGAIAAISFRRFGTDVIRLFGLALIRTIYKVRVTGTEYIPKHGGVLLLPNHVTWADAFFLSAASPRPVRFVMDEAFMANPWVSKFSRIFQTIPIERGSPREAIRLTAAALKAGEVLCLFPEGQLSRTGTLSELQRGFELIGRMAKCPLIPMWVAGAWGSVFSFERGRFFGKRPYKLPHEISVAFGAPLDPAMADTRMVRDAMLEASTEAIKNHFVAEDPHSTHDPLGGLLWANGYQLGQVNALPRDIPFATLAADPQPGHLFAVTTAFPELCGATCLSVPEFRPLTASHWLGGAVLREAISHAPDAAVVFFDFSDDALTSLERPGLIHCPCLAVNGIVVAMSMPDPPPPLPTSEVQLGSKPGSWGKLLPGFVLRNDSGGPRIHGPAAPDAGLPLPGGTTLDDEGFLTVP